MPERERLTIELSPQEERALQRLLETGLYGHSLQDVAERLIASRLLEILPTIQDVEGGS